MCFFQRLFVVRRARANEAGGLPPGLLGLIHLFFVNRLIEGHVLA